MQDDPEGHVAAPTGSSELGIVLAATRELLWSSSASDVSAVAARLVRDLGGRLVAAEDAAPDAIPVDLSFGSGPPLLPTASPASEARGLLTRHLPGFVRDGHRVIELIDRSERLSLAATTDPLTQLPNRREIGRAIARLQPHEHVIMLDLDGFKELNDTEGHAEGDRVLATLGAAIQATIRARDLAGRYGGEEFVIVLSGAASSDAAEAFLRRLRTRWCEMRPHPITFSAGIAAVGTTPSAALREADAAMYEAKRAGRDRWVWAELDEVTG